VTVTGQVPRPPLGRTQWPLTLLPGVARPLVPRPKGTSYRRLSAPRCYRICRSEDDSRSVRCSDWSYRTEARSMTARGSLSGRCSVAQRTRSSSWSCRNLSNVGHTVSRWRPSASKKASRSGVRLGPDCLASRSRISRSVHGMGPKDADPQSIKTGGAESDAMRFREVRSPCSDRSASARRPARAVHRGAASVAHVCTHLRAGGGHSGQRT